MPKCNKKTNPFLNEFWFVISADQISAYVAISVLRFVSWRPLMLFIVCTEVLLRRRFFILYYPVPSWSVLLLEMSSCLPSQRQYLGVEFVLARNKTRRLVMIMNSSYDEQENRILKLCSLDERNVKCWNVALMTSNWARFLPTAWTALRQSEGLTLAECG